MRSVDWKGTVTRDQISTLTRNTLGAITTIFNTGEDAEKEILILLAKPKPSELMQPDEQLEALVEGEFERARELIKDKVLSPMG